MNFIQLGSGYGFLNKNPVRILNNITNQTPQLEAIRIQKRKSLIFMNKQRQILKLVKLVEIIAN
jgi:hypothetical protein